MNDVTITAVKLRRLLNMVPDNTPVYIVLDNNENGFIDNVILESDEDDKFIKFKVRIDYHI